VASIATSRIESDFRPFDQFIDPSAGAADRKALPARARRNVQPVFRYINANINIVHLIPSLRKRAR
jgi:hypothetical protein